MYSKKFLYFLFFQAFALLLLQAYFYNIQTINSEKTKSTIALLLKYEKINHNPYTLAETLQTLEQTGLIRCTTLSLGKDDYIYFNTHKISNCNTGLFNLNGKEIFLSMKSISGVSWNIKTISLNTESFDSILNLSRAFAVLILFFIYFAFVLFDKNKRLQIELLNKEAVIFQQVAHDVRSPLFALRKLIDNESLTISDVAKIRMSFDRLDSILQETELKKNSGEKSNENFDLLRSVKEVVDEKMLIQEKKIKVNFINNEDEVVFIVANKSHIQRIISNLLNNSIEATKKIAQINITLKIENELIKLIIHDNGPGFPESILSSLGKVRASHGKEALLESGSGIGLLHASQYIKSIGGEIEFSNRDIGAQITISLKYSKIETKSTDSFEYLYIEDDQMMCLLWEERARKLNVSLLTINHPNDFKNIQDRIDLKTKIYCDSDFKDCKGEYFLESLFDKGYKNLFLTTGYSPSRFQPNNKYLVLGKMIPF